MSSFEEQWYRVSDSGMPTEGGRIHLHLSHRYVTLFRHHNKLYCIDSICHHAGGPLTLGRMTIDIGVDIGCDDD
jgi:nitrite reductase/ring-hydroxylating ferredoxin subunit